MLGTTATYKHSVKWEITKKNIVKAIFIKNSQSFFIQKFKFQSNQKYIWRKYYKPFMTGCSIQTVVHPRKENDFTDHSKTLS